MKLFLLYFNAFLHSLAVLCVTFNCTTGIPSRDKRDLQEELNKFEITIQNLLRLHHGSSKKGGSTRARIFDNSLEGKNPDEQAQKDGKFEERLAKAPEAIDMAFQPQKQRNKNQKGHRKFVPQLDEESEGRREKQEKPSVSESNLDTSGEEDNEDETEKKHSTNEKIKKNPVKDDRDNIKNNKKDLDVSLHQPRRKNYTSLNDSFIPDAIDLSFSNGPTRKSSTRTTTANPTTLYWPPTTTSSPTSNKICRSQIDLGFLIEASKSVAQTGPGNYRRMIDFVKHVVLKFAIGPTATRIGVISYANRPILMMGFHDGENILDVLKYLNLPCHHCWNAQTGLALSFAQSLLYGCSCNLRPRVLVVVTDGRSNDGVHIPSRILKQNGVKIISVGVGRYFNIEQLNAMASGPVQQNVFTGDFNKIHHVTDEIARQICNAADGSMVPSSSSPCKCS